MPMLAANITPALNGTNGAISIARFTYTVIGLMELSYACVGAPMNLLVITFAKRASRKEMARHQVLVMSMSFADLMHTSIHSTVMFLRFGLGLQPPPSVSAWVYIMTYISTISSSLSLLLLNIDKFIYVKMPLQYRAIVTRPRLAVAILVAWSTSFIFAGLILYGPWTRFNGSDFEPKHLHLYITFVLLFITLPNLISFYVSTLVVVIVVRHQRAMDAVVGEATVMATAEAFELTTPDSVAVRQVRIPFKSILFVFSATVWSVCTTIPYRVGFTLIHFKVISNTQAVFALFGLMGLHPTFNPFITLVTHKLYRNMLAEYICRKRIDTASRCSSMHSVTVTRHKAGRTADGAR